MVESFLPPGGASSYIAIYLVFRTELSGFEFLFLPLAGSVTLSKLTSLRLGFLIYKIVVVIRLFSSYSGCKD